MYDMRDIREILIHRANFNFSLMKVKSLLAYKIFLYVILNADRKLLCRSNELLLDFESFTDLASKLKLFYGASKDHGRSSIKAALGYLEKSCVIMSASEKPTDEEIEVLELKHKPYLSLYLDIEELRDGHEQEFFDNNYRFKIFDSYFMPQIKALNEIIHRKNVSLMAYQMAIYLIFQLEPKHFEDTFETEEGEIMGSHEFIVDSFKDFSSYFSTFVDYELIHPNTVSDNLEVLHEIGFIYKQIKNPNEEEEYQGVGYADNDHLHIMIPLVLPMTHS